MASTSIYVFKNSHNVLLDFHLPYTTFDLSKIPVNSHSWISQGMKTKSQGKICLLECVIVVEKEKEETD